MAKRTTIEVSKIKAMVNHRLATWADSPDTRKALASLLSIILMEDDNYHGFQYLAWLDGGCDKWNSDGCPKDKAPYLGDQTRIVFI